MGDEHVEMSEQNVERELERGEEEQMEMLEQNVEREPERGEEEPMEMLEQNIEESLSLSAHARGSSSGIVLLEELESDSRQCGSALDDFLMQEEQEHIEVEHVGPNCNCNNE